MHIHVPCCSQVPKLMAMSNSVLPSYNTLAARPSVVAARQKSEYIETALISQLVLFVIASFSPYGLAPVHPALSIAYGCAMSGSVVLAMLLILISSSPTSDTDPDVDPFSALSRARFFARLLVVNVVLVAVLYLAMCVVVGRSLGYINIEIRSPALWITP